MGNVLARVEHQGYRAEFAAGGRSVVMAWLLERATYPRERMLFISFYSFFPAQGKL